MFSSRVGFDLVSVITNTFAFKFLVKRSATYTIEAEFKLRIILRDSAEFCKILHDSAILCEILLDSVRFCKIL